ncbi:MAG TPA: hypothetical protein VK797_20630 [Tepidisphaeraceae bacterium]|jgi:hypothetical protein|nr:hypothetical protein [Tepidisphaeraceae bacterium]
MLQSPQQVIDRLAEFQRAVRDVVIQSRQRSQMFVVSRHSSADTIYQIDTMIEPLLEDFCREWSKTTPLVLIAEGVECEGFPEGMKVFPDGTAPEGAAIRLIVDPIDGTRGIMYDKRAAWALAGVAPNKVDGTQLSDVEAAVMTELPTSKMGFGDVLWAIKGRGAIGRRVDLSSGDDAPLGLHPSTAINIDHGFASVANFFPGTKVLASELMEYLASKLVGDADVMRSAVFDDQYISTGGQFYELIVGHDRFNADLRPVFYDIQNQPPGLCCHPYDCAAILVAQEAGIILTNATGGALDGPLDVTSGLSWAGYANTILREKIEPLLLQFLQNKRKNPTTGRNF